MNKYLKLHTTHFTLYILTVLLLMVGGCQKKKKADVDTYHVTPKNVNEMFDDFFTRFASDSLFQKEQIKFPLLYISTDIEDNVEEIIIEENEWTFIDFTQDGISDDSGIDEFDVIIVRENRGFIYTRRGIDNGIYIEYHFSDLEETWQLTKINNQST